MSNDSSSGMLSHSSGNGSPVGDFLGHVLRDLKPSRASYCRTEVRQPWGIGLEFEQGVRFHFVAEGHCWVLVEGLTPERLEQGDVVLLPHGTRHAIADDPQSAITELSAIGPTPVSEISSSYRMKTGGSGARSLIFCCTVAFDEPLAHQLIGSIPTRLIMRNEAGRTTTLRQLLDVIAQEMAEDNVGSATVTARLADAAISMVIRDWVSRRKDTATGWLAALRDPSLRRALLGIHLRPSEPWTLVRLADEAAMSRSAFVERFSSALGVSPARYVAEWRMQRAKGLLQERRLPMSEVATQVGYTSEAAFSRAFKRIVGTPPGAIRRNL